MREYIKKTFPALYEYINHVKRVMIIRKIKKLKKLPEAKYSILLSKLYKKRIGHNLNWNNLVTYTEKMQWEKLYNKNPLKVILADKYKVRKWVKERIGEEYLIPLHGVWKNFDEIDFDKLPSKFVLKTNHGSGTNYIVRDKSKINKKQIKRMFNDWLKIDYAYYTGFEMHYSAIEPVIIAEEYIENKGEEKQLQDYKFLCFNGKPYYCWVDMNRYTNHTRNVYDLHWNLQPWNQASYGIYKETIKKPKNFEKMIELVETLCSGFAQVRVDLYNIDGKIYFGEMTFTNGSGLDPIIPEKYDRIMGDLWEI